MLCELTELQSRESLLCAQTECEMNTRGGAIASKVSRETQLDANSTGAARTVCAS